MVLFQSFDFVHWEPTTTLGFNRAPTLLKLDHRYQHAGTLAGFGSAGEQCHLGAGLKNRSSVVLGMYGQWHGHESNDRRLITMDLGFVIR
jgi:hypothetical protein